MIQSFKLAQTGTPTERFIGWVLADCHNEQTGQCDPTVAYLMRVTGYGNKAISRGIAALERAGHLSVARRFGAHNTYRLHPKTRVPETLVDHENQCPKDTGSVENPCPSDIRVPKTPVSLSPKTRVPETKTRVPETKTRVPETKTRVPGTHKPEEPVLTGIEPEGKTREARPRPPTKRELRISEAAETTAACALPPELDTPEFRAAWDEWCQHRGRLAADDACKAWTPLAARNGLKQCQERGEAWAIVEIRHSLSNSWQGLQWDQRRNPADVRSQPMLPVVATNGKHVANQPGDFNRWEEES